MGRIRSSVLTCLLLATRAESRPLTVEDAVNLAKSASPRLSAVEEDALAAGDDARSARGRLLPSVHLSDEYQRWNGAFSAPLGANGAALVVRDAQTNTFVAALDQPIVGLLRTSEDYRSARARRSATGARAKTELADVTQAVETYFLRHFEARTMQDIAHASEVQLQEQVTVARSRLNAGVLTTADVLRAEVALANARQQEIFARSDGNVARAQLFGVIGVPNDPTIELVEPRALLDRSETPLPPLPDAERVAIRARPEVLELAQSTAAAEHHQRALEYSLLPEIDFEASYVRSDGQLFALPNAEFVGLRASWTIWEWGASWYQMRSAQHAANAQRLRLADEQRRVATDVESRLSEAAAAASAVEIARTTIVSAEEAYRVTASQQQHGVATTTDLLDAQSALTTARLNFARARYELAVARVALVRAMGE